MTLPKHLNQKYETLQRILREYGSGAVAFSGGVDSTFLLHAASQALGDRVIAITTTAPFFPMRESKETKEFCDSRGIRQIVCAFDGLEIEGFADNPPNRCYFCKKTLFSNMRRVAGEQGMDVIMEGSNTDDDGDYRPGHIAIRELGVRSPLREAGLSKDDIRQLSEAMGLPTWNKPSFACLASRFPYGQTITREKLRMVEQAEEFLLAGGFTQMRVRIHESVGGDLIARIELPEEDIPKMAEGELRKKIRRRLHELGFAYVSLDLAGFVTGSMNRTLDEETLQQGLNGGPVSDAEKPGMD